MILYREGKRVMECAVCFQRVTTPGHAPTAQAIRQEAKRQGWARRKDGQGGMVNDYCPICVQDKR